jgi:PASTA domain
MADTIHVPLLGNVKPVYLYGGIGAVVIIGGIAYYRHQAATAAASNSAASTSTDTSGTGSADPNAIDPSTGLTYAEEASGSQGSFPYGGVSDYGGSYYGNGNITGYDQYGNPIYSTGITGSNTYTTNADWATAAEDDLAALNVDSATSATAISRILAGLTVTHTQEDLFMQAVGLLGQPPQGYPKPIKVTTTPSQPNPPKTSSTATVPNVVGMGFGEAYNTLHRAGFKTNPAKANANYKVISESPPGGRQATKGGTITLKVKP